MSEHSGLPLAIPLLIAGVIIAVWKALSPHLVPFIHRRFLKSDEPRLAIWQRLYSTPSLLFIATLAVAIWSWNLSSLYSSSAVPPSKPLKPAEEILGAQPTLPSSAVDLYEQEMLRTTPSPPLTPIPFDEFIKRAGLRATAICADGTYSYSANRRRTCSQHGGVAHWLPR
jgi:Protein of unknown function (DUF3761)